MYLILVLISMMTTSLFPAQSVLEEYTDQDTGNNYKIGLFNNYPRPSPINLDRSSMITKRTITPLYFSPEHSTNAEFKRGTTEDGLEITLNFDNRKPNISGGPLKASYEFNKLYFHWDNSSNRTRGSYHAVNGEYYPLEMQAYYKIIRGSFFFEFLQRKVHHTAIVSIFFELSTDDNPIFQDINDETKSFSLDKLIPPLEEYVSYKGSLVVSPFTENVKWIISLNPQKISKQQLGKLQQIRVNDVRPIQPLYGRRVFYIIP